MLTTGTGSGKSLAYMVPIVDHVLRTRRDGGQRIRAIVVYPMNALANSQEEELRKFLSHGYPDGAGPVTFRRFTGQENDEQREEIRSHPPDILLTNYVMLEYILTRPFDQALVRAAEGLSYLVLDELHTYRGRQGADVALLVRRVRDACKATNLRCVGTSATLAGPGTFARAAGRGGERSQAACSARRCEPESDHRRDATPGDYRRRPGGPRLPRAACLIASVPAQPPETYEETIADPLACWIERTLGIAFNEADGRYFRCVPRPLRGKDGAGALLAAATGLSEEVCLESLQAALLTGSRIRSPDGFSVFAFRLHQFFSGGSAVAVSIGAGV